MSPEINDSDEVVFSAPVSSGTASSGIFLYRDGAIHKVVDDTDTIPGDPSLILRPATALLNDMGMIAFSSGLADISGRSVPGSFALLLDDQGRRSRLLAQGDAAPGTDGSRFTQLKGFSLSQAGDVIFHSNLCCGTFKEGIFRASLPRANIANGNFETPGDWGLPANWRIAWNTSGSGEVIQYAGGGADPSDGKSLLRLHVDPGGGAVFVLSDPIPLSPETVYLVNSRMRYNLASDSDGVYFSVIQSDARGNQVGFDEVVGRKGDNFWTWLPKGLMIHSSPTAASIRIRFGLAATSEAYLDVDAVR